MTESIVTATVEAGLRPDRLLDYALAYADHGLRTVPAPLGEKAPRLKGWPELATCDEAQLQDWFGYGNSNICIATGRGSGVFVLDIDTKHDGFARLAALEEKHGSLPATWTAVTGTGGGHLYFRLPQNFDGKIANRTGLSGELGLDIRGEGGQVVAPPSLHPNGESYCWREGCAPWECDLAPAPDWLIELVVQNPPKPPGGKSGGAPNSLGTILEGGRNNTLFRRACGLRARGLDAVEIKAAIKALNAERCDTALDGAEVDRLIQSAMKYDPTGGYPINEIGNARRLVERFGSDIRYVAGSKTWLAWDGSVWQPDAQLELEAMAKDILDELDESLELVPDPEERKALQSACRRQMTHAKLRGTIACAASEPGVAIRGTDFDADENLLNAANGTIDLRTGKLRPHRKEDLITRKIEIEYKPEAPRPNWDRFVSEIFDGDHETVRFVQTCFGYAATARMDEQSVFFLVGGGANGKSTLLGTIEKVLGPYAGPAPAKTFMVKSNDNGVGDDLVFLAGKRLVSISETGSGKKLDAPLVKRITGGDTLAGRALFGRYGPIQPTMKLFLATNHLPSPDADDPAMWRRAVVIPFEVVFPPEKQDPDLGRKLLEERPGILAWIAEGAARWFDQGRLIQPPRIAAATEAYRRESDVVGRFIEEVCERAPAYFIPSRQLHSRFTIWCSIIGQEPLREKAFSRRLESLGFKKEKLKQGICWMNLRDRSDPPIG